MNHSKPMKRLLVEANELASRDIDEFVEAMDDLVASREQRFQRYQIARQCRESLLNKIGRAFPDSVEQRCLAALRSCAEFGGVTHRELQSLGLKELASFDFLVQAGYEVRQVEREEALVEMVGFGGMSSLKPLPYLPDNGKAPDSFSWGTVTAFALA